MDRNAGARVWFGATAAAVVVGVVVSNLLVALTCLLLAVRLDRGSTAFWVLRLTALVVIAVTGIVFHVALKACRTCRALLPSPTSCCTRCRR